MDLEQTQRFIDNVARVRGWTVNPDAEFRTLLAEGLATNRERYGYYLCPCRDGEGDRQADRAIVCPCQYARPDIDEYGRCYCALFMTASCAAAGGPLEQIPERHSAF